MTNIESGSDRAWTLRGIDAKTMRQLTKEMPATELWSLLLGVIEQRASTRAMAAVADQWRDDRFVQPAVVDPRVSLRIDQHLFAVADSFEAIELSPLAPLGTSSVLAPTSQNRVVSTVRGTEVVSDPTNVLALECARRLREDATQIVKFASSHRCVRAQPFPKLPGFAAHFRMFCLATAGHETKDQAFTVDALADHIGTHLRSITTLRQNGYALSAPSVTLLSTQARRSLSDRIASRLLDVTVKHEVLTKPYYNGLRFMINVAGSAGEIPLVDGGAFDWVAKLAANRKLVFVASAIGSQLLAHLFGRESIDRADGGP
jgi:hypothetical protein